MNDRARLQWTRWIAVLTIALALGSGGVASGQSGITSPEEFFGHQMGADRELARWDRMVEYFQLLDDQSDRVHTVDLGPSTEGHPFLLVVISSPENLANSERIAEISRSLADPRGFSDSEVEAMISEGKAVVVQSLGLHATEVAGTQASPELAWEFATRTDAEAQRILDETVLLLLPCINPDGQVMVTDWYRETVGTEYEGADLPFLYHRYGGHDNNRDGDFLNMVESTYIAQVMYRDWKPQAYVDHHQMGSYGARFYVPPYSEPIRPGADPLIWREISWYGAHIATKLEAADMTGVLNAAQYPGWGHFGWHWITPFHNIAGMLTESASATLATPLYLHPDQLSGGARGLPEYEAQSNMPNPWPGGWWRVRDIVEQQKVAAWALQDMAARNRETVLRNAYLKAVRQIERGEQGDTKAWVIPADQHDPLTAKHMINTLLRSDLEIHQAENAFSVEGMHYEAGSFVVPAAQPKRGLVSNLINRTFYPDNEWTRGRDGAPLRPYDTATHTMNELMGVRVDPVAEAVDGDFERLHSPLPMVGRVGEGSHHRLDGRLNASYRAVNLLLDMGVDVRRVHRASGEMLPGDFIVSGGADELRSVAETTGVEFSAATDSGEESAPLTRARLGMYQRYRGGNMDEGWTRLVLENFDFPYTSVMDAEILAGDLAARYDVIILPHDSGGAITGAGGGGRYGGRRTPTPPEYESGIGEDGVASLKAFVEAGGTLVTIGRAAEFAIDEFELSVRNVLEGIPSTEFFCPGSTLRVHFDNDHRLAYGMPEQGYALFWDSPAFQIVPSRDNDRYELVVTYVDRDILQSGWLIGEEHLANRAAMVSASVGKGSVVLIGVRAQHRAQTHGTFKLLFNTILR